MLVLVTETAVPISLFAVGLGLRTPLTLKGWRVAAILGSTGMLVTIAIATALPVVMLALGLLGVGTLGAHGLHWAGLGLFRLLPKASDRMQEPGGARRHQQPMSTR